MDNSDSINIGLEYLRKVLSMRLKSHFEGSSFDIDEVDFDFNYSNSDSPLSLFCRKNQLSNLEYLLLMVVLTPQVIPNFLDSIIVEYIPKAGDLPEIGAVRGKNSRGILPTFQTFLFIAGGLDLRKIFSIRRLINSQHFLFRDQIIKTDNIEEGEPFINSKIYLSDDYVEFFMFGQLPSPRFNRSFPAKIIKTQLNWDDLVLNEKTTEYVLELVSWLENKEDLSRSKYDLNRDLSGYRALFYGYPGTGKTMTASILGKMTGFDVYRIDLSILTSKFIGETEKNISNLFSRAKGRRWILLFDEADGLFGRRTNVRNSNDRYANQEVSFLLQEIERYNGMIILVTNNFNKIDDSFKRRFQSIIYFPLPKERERKAIWEKSFPVGLELESNIDMKSIAEKFELSGADIVNTIESIRLRLISRNDTVVTYEDVHFAVRKEYAKYGKVLKF